MKSVKDLNVYKYGFQLALDIYKITEKFPKTEQFGLTQQMRRAAISINSNLSEGGSRNSSAEYRHFVGIAKGSAAELEFQIEISNKLGFVDDITAKNLVNSVIEIGKMLSGLCNSLQTTTNTSTNTSTNH
ncbi:MAG: four helix bundle protein [Rickettsiales bacterium]|nr:four helix bundle protein [Rickettsiales bacterium]